MRFDVITLFPKLFDEFFNTLPFKRALQKGITEINIWDLRKYAIDSYGTVDDKPYGGGKGMILRVEPIYNALTDIYSDYYSIKSSKTDNDLNNVLKKAKSDKDVEIIAFTPKGETLDQKKAKSIGKFKQISLISGRYEGLDHRIIGNLATKRISLGNFILSGGEIPALGLMDSVLRLFPGVLDTESTKDESFEDGLLEHPQYTRPETFKGLNVPKVLISGDHNKIKEWREKNKKRPKNG
jgi:tRNA (guanine37-N1)-methyltransferase